MLSFIVFILAAQFKMERLYSMRLKARFQTTLVLERHDGFASFQQKLSPPPLPCGSEPLWEQG
ncbi:hypothetical protein, partial [Pseudomonas corrugata]|uniref:hypothetical protein n=1 Tax=Pseudomonas corrugata TaxID=47879 RepID=UPI0019D704DD